MSASRESVGAAGGHGPWNPGLRSPVPRALLPLCTLYRPDNALAGVEEVRELADFTGLPAVELVAFRPARLVIHELLVRVAADISVPDGPDPEDLGINFRRMTATIADRHVAPHLAGLERAWETLRAELLAAARRELDTALFTAAGTAAAAPGWLERLGLRRPAPAGPAGREPATAREARALRAWRGGGPEATREERVLRRALADVVGAVLARHGRLVGDRDLLARLAADRAGNQLGSERLGRMIEPHIDAAIRAEGYRRLPAQERPVVMNTKGASAAGKSTMRPRQRALAARIGVDWADFALVSPDIFRKYLLDYDSLGDAYKYAGMLAGEELQVIDEKLDRHIAEKAARGTLSHLLIDRFRFDSFAPESDEQGSNLLTRFGADIYMFFMVTPPHATVERAWERGLRVGRYKTVDDLLHHNVEAFEGMPELFFTWAMRADKSVHHEFLDNGVAVGEAPRTIAFGADRGLVVLDVGGMLDIDRFRKIDVDATGPGAVYPPAAEMAPERNLGFLRQCVDRLARVDFADRDGGRVYLRVEGGVPAAWHRGGLRAAADGPETRAALAALFPRLLPAAEGAACDLDEVLEPAAFYTLGSWGERRGSG